MARKVFFSFHFDRDSRRVAQVRHAHAIGNYDKPPFLEAADWETVKRKGEPAIKNWIDNNLHGSSVTVVLIGKETYTRKWVLYEIEQSYRRGNGLLGVTLHNINDPMTGTDTAGQNPFGYVKDSISRKKDLMKSLKDIFRVNGLSGSLTDRITELISS